MQNKHLKISSLAPSCRCVVLPYHKLFRAIRIPDALHDGHLVSPGRQADAIGSLQLARLLLCNSGGLLCWWASQLIHRAPRPKKKKKKKKKELMANEPNQL